MPQFKKGDRDPNQGYSSWTSLLLFSFSSCGTLGGKISGRKSNSLALVRTKLAFKLETSCPTIRHDIDIYIAQPFILDRLSIDLKVRTHSMESNRRHPYSLYPCYDLDLRSKLINQSRLREMAGMIILKDDYTSNHSLETDPGEQAYLYWDFLSMEKDRWGNLISEFFPTLAYFL